MVTTSPVDTSPYWQAAARLRGWMKATGVSVEELARAAGVFPFVIRMILDGVIVPTRDERRELGRYLRINPFELVEKEPRHE